MDSARDALQVAALCIAALAAGCTSVASTPRVDVPSIAPPAPPDPGAWSRRFGGGSSHVGMGVAIGPSGDLLITGEFSGSGLETGAGHLLTSAGDDDVFVAACTSGGRILWAKSFGGPGFDFPSEPAVDAAGNIHFTGSVNSPVDFGGGVLEITQHTDGILVTLDHEGKHLWSKRFGGPDMQYGDHIAVDAEGNASVTGRFAEVVNLGGGPIAGVERWNGFVARFDPAGKHLFSMGVGTAARGDSGEHYLAGAVAVDSDGSTVIAGTIDRPAEGRAQSLDRKGVRGFVAKVGPAGETVWVRRFGSGQAYTSWDGVAIDGAGRIVVVGSSSEPLDLGGGVLPPSGGLDVVVAVLRSSGEPVWSRRSTGTALAWAASVAVDPRGGIHILGTAGPYNPGNDYGHRPKGPPGTLDLGGGTLVCESHSIFVAELTGAGAHVWSRNYDDAGAFAHGIAADAAGHTFVTGSFTGTIDFGTGPLLGLPDRDVFLARVGP